MLSQDVINKMRELFKGDMRLNEPLSRHTTWRIGGAADIFAEPSDTEGLCRLVKCARGNNLPITVIGNGSNLLVRDGGIRGLVIRLGKDLSRVSVRGNVITAGAGAVLGYVAKIARDSGISGFEFTAGIPGTIGGAVIMNAGANGSSMSDVVQRVTVMGLNGRIVNYEAGELEFGYRRSCLCGKNVLILEVICRGDFADPEKINLNMERYMARRRLSQPLKYPSAGSVFKNPPGYSAGKLIEEAGCKGMMVGDAQVSSIHANFIVNLGSASARDVLQLVELVQEMVYRRFNIVLPLEVQVLGED